MEATYSITVHNKYSLALDEDEDPLEVLKIREAEKEAKKKEKLSEKENKSKQPETQKSAGTKTQKIRVIKDVQQQAPKIQETKKDQGWWNFSFLDEKLMRFIMADQVDLVLHSRFLIAIFPLYLYIPIIFFFTVSHNFADILCFLYYS